jgi:hypothetical protein
MGHEEDQIVDTGPHPKPWRVYSILAHIANLGGYTLEDLRELMVNDVALEVPFLKGILLGISA